MGSVSLFGICLKGLRKLVELSASIVIGVLTTWKIQVKSVTPRLDLISKSVMVRTGEREREREREFTFLRICTWSSAYLSAAP
jgi:hypothetical protein